MPNKPFEELTDAQRETDTAIKAQSHVNKDAYPAMYKKWGQWFGIISVTIILGLIFLWASHKKTTTVPAVSTTALNQMQSAEMELQANLAQLKSEETTLAPPPVEQPMVQSTMPQNTTQNYLARQNAPTKMYAASISNPSSMSGANNESQPATFVGNDGYSRFGNQASGFTTLSATQIVHPEDTIASGEFMHAVLETAVDSDLPGMVRAVISEPVYAYVGEKPLIPAGSRLIGQYSSAVMQGMTRVFVIWNRVILPNGITIQINSPGADALGAAGMEADSVNTHFFAQFGEAALLSVLGAGAANVGVSPDDENNSASMYRQAISQSFQQSAQQSLTGTVAIKPTLTVYQGANIIVFVAHDLSFYQVLNALNSQGESE